MKKQKNLNRVGTKGLIILLICVLCIGAADAEESDVESSFLGQEAGISAYTNVGCIDLEKVKSVFKTIEKETNDYIIGSIALPDLDDTYNIHCYVQKDGLIIAYYFKDAPVSKIFGKKYGSSKEIDSNNLRDVLDIVASKIGVSVNDVEYYDFRYPSANKMTKITGSDFRFKIPSDFILYEASSANTNPVVERGGTCLSLGGCYDGSYLHISGGGYGVNHRGPYDKIDRITLDEFYSVDTYYKGSIVLIYHEPITGIVAGERIVVETADSIDETVLSEHPPAPPKSCTSDSACRKDEYCGSDKLCHSKKNNENSCSENGECSSGSCVGGICKPRGYCNSDANCDSSKYCLNHKCVSKKSANEKCSSDNECLGNYCKDGKCQRITLYVKVDGKETGDVEKILMFIPPGYSGYKKLTLSTDKGEVNDVKMDVTGEVADWFQKEEPFRVSMVEIDKYLYLKGPSDISPHRSYYGILKINDVEKPIEVEVPNIETNLQCDRAYFDKNKKFAHCSAAVVNLGDEIKNVYISLKITSGGAIGSCQGIDNKNIGIAMIDKPVLNKYDKVLLDCNIELTDPNIEYMDYKLQMNAENPKIGESFAGEKSEKIYVKDLPVVEKPPESIKEPTSSEGLPVTWIMGGIIVLLIIIILFLSKRR